MSSHNHCLSCYHSKCDSLNDGFCPIISCPKSCGQFFHQCKSEDHLLLCQKMVVPCLNSLYGCPITVIRHKMEDHLRVCPANIIYCPFKWYREPSKKSEAPFKKYSLESPVLVPQIDIALTINDQHKDVLNEVKGSFIQKKILKLNFDIDNDDGKVIIENNIENEKYLKTSLETFGIKNNSSEINFYLDSEIKAYPMASNLPNTAIPLTCNEVVRRDGFCHHFRNLHSEVQAWGDHWQDHRCALASLGCTFSQTRLKPQNAFFIFDTRHHQFRVVPELYVSHSDPLPSIHFSKSPTFNFVLKPAEKFHSHTPFDILKLPHLLIDHILSYLDPYDLRTLSLVSVGFRELCGDLLRRKGMVEMKWKKIISCGRSHWKIISHVWRFPNGFTPIKSWQFCEEESLSNHLSFCPFNVKKAYKQRVPINCKNYDMIDFDYGDCEQVNIDLDKNH